MDVLLNVLRTLLQNDETACSVPATDWRSAAHLSITCTEVRKVWETGKIAEPLVIAISPDTDIMHVLSFRTWVDTVETTVPRGRSMVGAAAADGCIYVIGGQIDEMDVTLVDAYDMEMRIWSSLSRMRTARSLPQVLVMNKCLYVLGGERIRHPRSSSVERLHLATCVWTIQPQLPLVIPSLSGSSVVGIARSIYALGYRRNNARQYHDSISLHLVELPPSEMETYGTWLDLSPIPLRLRQPSTMFNVVSIGDDIWTFCVDGRIGKFDTHTLEWNDNFANTVRLVFCRNVAINAQIYIFGLNYGVQEFNPETGVARFYERMLPAFANRIFSTVARRRIQPA